MTSNKYNQRDICDLNLQISARSLPLDDPSGSSKFSFTTKKHEEMAIKIFAITFAITAFALLTSGAAMAQRVSSSIAWGNLEISGESSSHADDAYTALLVEKGRSANLPGTTVYAIGVHNSINVIGDDNLLTSSQEGENNGDVTSELTFNQ